MEVFIRMGVGGWGYSCDVAKSHCHVGEFGVCFLLKYIINMSEGGGRGQNIFSWIELQFRSHKQR